MYAYGVDHKSRVFPRALEALEEISCVSERQQMLGMMDGYLGAGLEKRAEWGDVWLAPPLCFGLLLDELLGFRDASRK